MKHWMRKLSAAALALSLLTPQAALASEALGWDLHAGTAALSEGTTVTQGYFWSDTYRDLRTERYVTYTPNEDVKPSVSYGDYVLQKSTLSAMAKKLEAAGRRVVGGTNGDFYVMSTGQPLGLVVTDGIVRSSSSYHYAVGFRADGTAFIGQPSLQVTATLGGERLAVSGGINKVRQVTGKDNGGLMLLTQDFAEKTENSMAGVDVVLVPMTEGLGETVSAEESGVGQELVLTDRPRIGGRIRCTVDYIMDAAGATTLHEGRLVLTLNGKEDEALLEKLRALQSGDEVTIDMVCADTRWNEAVEALGGMYRLLDNGQIGANLSAEQTARTAVGVKADGTVLFYTIDGKQPGKSVGAACTQVAQRLQELGCVDAIGLDGGGSTTLGVTYPDKDAMEVINSPSDGAQRAVSNAVFLTTQLQPTGEPGALSLTPGDAMVLSGAKLWFSASQLDTAWYDMGKAEGVWYTAEGAGTVGGDGTFTAGSASGTAVVTGTLGENSGQATVTVVDTPDAITVLNEETWGEVKNISLDPGESLSLTARSTWRKLALTSQDECYTWACDPAVGTVSADGTFTAGEEGATGTLTVTAGGRTAVIPVNVAGYVHSLEDMERENSAFISTQSALLSTERTLNQVRTGYQSLRIDYDAGESGVARVEADVAIPAGEKYLGLWVYGDESGNSLTATVESADGTRTALAVAGLSFSGWKHVLAPLPQGAVKLTALEVVYGGGERASGTLWLDQLTSANDAIEDMEAPQIDLRVEGRTLTATVGDNVDRDLPREKIRVTLDGQELTPAWDSADGLLTAELPALGTGAHRVSVTAEDQSGNVGRASYDIAGTETVQFADMENHWAAPYAGYLYQQGITKGTAEGDVLYYKGDADITRAEFFTMAARWLGLDLTQYEAVALPFADAADIPAWALSAVKAMYAEGIVTGSLEGGALYAHAGATITRVEVMAILGRTQQRGYPEAELTCFTDADQVPAWAAAYVRSLVGQGVVNGYEDGTLRPTATMSRGQVAKVLYALR